MHAPTHAHTHPRTRAHTHTSTLRLTQMFFPSTPSFPSFFFLPTSPFQTKQNSCKHRVPVGWGGGGSGIPQRLTQALVLSDRHSTVCLTVPWSLLPGCTAVVPAWPLQIRGMGGYGEKGCTGLGSLSLGTKLRCREGHVRAIWRGKVLLCCDEGNLLKKLFAKHFFCLPFRVAKAIFLIML